MPSERKAVDREERGMCYIEFGKQRFELMLL